MADNVIFQSTTAATPPAATVISTEEITTLNGAGVAAQQVQRIIPAARTADGVGVDLVGQKVRAQSLPIALSTEDVQLLTDLLRTTPLPVTGTFVATGTVGIDQTTPGTTDSVTIKASAGIGSLTETPPTTDIASSGLNGRLARIAQNITSLIAKFANDSTDRIRVSLYGKVSAAGDTAVLLSTAGRQLIAGGAANTAGAAITGGTVTSVDSADAARALAVALFGYNGSTNDPVRIANKFYDMSAVAIGSIATVATPTAGKKFRIMGGMISVSAAASVLFEDNAGGATVFRTPKLLVDTPFAFTLLGNGFLSAAANNVVKATSSAAANITGILICTEE